MNTIISKWELCIIASAILFFLCLSDVSNAQQITDQALSPDVSNAQPITDQVVSPMEEEDQTGRDFGYGVSSVLASVIYSPLKVTYAGLGLMTGGMGFVLTGGRGDVANNIIYPAIQGHYVITPDHLRGSEPIIFIGSPPGNGSKSESQAEIVAPPIR